MTTATISRKAQAEAFIVRLDTVQDELQNAQSREEFESCKAELAAIKAEIETLGYLAERCVTGWRLVQPVAVAVAGEVAPAASPEKVTPMKQSKSRKSESVLRIASHAPATYRHKETGKVYDIHTVESGRDGETVTYSVWATTSGLACHCTCSARQYNTGKACKHMVFVTEQLKSVTEPSVPSRYCAICQCVGRLNARGLCEVCAENRPVEMAA